jgi:serine/threonine-protein kinase ATR
MDEQTRCQFISSLAKVACIACNYTEHVDEDRVISAPFICSFCDTNELYQDRQSKSTVFFDKGEHDSFCKELILVVNELIKHPDMNHSARPRILLTIAIRRLYNHISDSQMLDLFTSPTGQWCLKALTSSVRELRLIAG